MTNYDPGAVAQMEAIWNSKGQTLDDAAKERWLGANGYLHKRGEVTGDGQRLKPFQAGDQIADYWQMRMGHDAAGTEFDPEGVARRRMGMRASQRFGPSSAAMDATQATPSTDRSALMALMHTGATLGSTGDTGQAATPGARVPGIRVPAEGPTLNTGDYGAPTYAGPSTPGSRVSGALSGLGPTSDPALGGDANAAALQRQALLSQMRGGR